MTRKKNGCKEALSLVRRLGIMRVKDALRNGVHPEHLRRLVAAKRLLRSGRGLYILAEGKVSVHHTLAEASKRVPAGVVCLLSALRFHELGTQNPRQVWLAIPGKARRPTSEFPPLRVVRFSGSAYTEGVETRRIDGVDVRIYNPAKCVADCFRYRNKIGLDVALEALRDCRRRRKATMDDLWRFAEICRVARVMKPYLEAIG